MIGSGEESGFKKSNTINRRMFIFAASKAVIFFGIVGRLFSLELTAARTFDLAWVNEPFTAAVDVSEVLIRACVVTSFILSWGTALILNFVSVP